MRYANYKATGIAWLPEVPREWAVRRLKYVITSLRKGNGITKDDVYEDGDLPCIRYGEIYSKYDVSFDKCLSATRKSLVTKPQYVQKGDILFSCTGELVDEIGKNIVYHGSDPCVAGGDIIVISHAQNPRYLNYYLNSYPTQRQKSYGKAKLKVVHLHTLDVQNIVTLLPSECEQSEIVAFLDEKCGKVNRLVAAKEKEVALLRELKQSMIAEAVTRGVRENRRLVPSGIPWLPEVPEGWKCGKVRQYFRLRVTKVSEKDYPPLSVAKVGVVPQLSDVAISMAEGDTRKLVKEGDYVVNSRSDRKGSCGIAPRDGSVTTISIVLEPHDIERKYVHYLFRSTPWVEEFYRNGRGIVADLWTTNFNQMRNMMLPVPPLAEQREIVAHIEARAAKMDAAVAGLEKAIAALKEYKQRLIADVVTGQRRVA